MGVYGGFVDKMPMGALMNKGLTLRTGQMHGQKYMPILLERVVSGEVDPSVAPAKKTIVSAVRPNLNVPTLSSSNPITKFVIPHNTLRIGEDSPTAGGEANGV